MADQVEALLGPLQLLMHAFPPALLVLGEGYTLGPAAQCEAYWTLVSQVGVVKAVTTGAQMLDSGEVLESFVGMHQHLTRWLQFPQLKPSITQLKPSITQLHLVLLRLKQRICSPHSFLY